MIRTRGRLIKAMAEQAQHAGSDPSTSSGQATWFTEPTEPGVIVVTY